MKRTFRTVFCRCTLALTLVAGLVPLTISGTTLAKDKGNPNPGILPPHSNPHGRSYDQWAAKWWQAAFATPIEDGYHPLFQGGAFGGDDGVLFLSGVGGGAVIDITIRPGTPLFFPVVNSECSFIEPDPFHGDNEAELRECANAHIDNTSDLFAVIDGVPVQSLGAYRGDSPLFGFGPLPADNILGAPEGATSFGVDAGVYLFLAPLSVGQHEISFGGTFDELGFSIDTTYRITVAPQKK